MKVFGRGWLKWLGGCCLHCAVIVWLIGDMSSAKAEFTEDQWDIYKLDPNYACLVRAHPQIPLITLVATPTHISPSTPSENNLPGKRRPLSPPTDSDIGIPLPTAPKKQRGRSPGVLTSSEDEDEDMTDTSTFNKGHHRSKSQLRDLHEKNRKTRRERTLRTQAKRERSQDREMDESMFSPTHEQPESGPRFQSMPPTPGSTSKRRKGVYHHIIIQDTNL